jgi:hypothetical protein
MWLVFARAPLPDAPYWPGRRLLAVVDAVVWPVAWVALAMHLSHPAGIAAPVVVALAVLSAVVRVHRAACQNHRYHFTTLRWGRVVAGLLLVGVAVTFGLAI